MRRHKRKLDFLMMEVNDIKNNKGKTTQQMKNLEPMINWVAKGAGDSQLSSE